MGNSTSKQTDTLDGNHLGKGKPSLSSSQRKSLSHIQLSSTDDNCDRGEESAVTSSGRQRPPMRLQRSASGADVTEKYLTQMIPIERLADILKRQSIRSNGTSNGGITADVFAVCISALCSFNSTKIPLIDNYLINTKKKTIKLSNFKRYPCLFCSSILLFLSFLSSFIQLIFR